MSVEWVVGFRNVFCIAVTVEFSWSSDVANV
jgi:hypothetical protein